jgi:putative membrane protein
MSLSGVLGLVAMNSRLPLADIFPGLDQSPLFPLLTGLFGVPTLLLSLGQQAIPHQSLGVGGHGSIRPSAKGALLGFLAGWMPGITSTTGTVIGTSLSPRVKEDEDESAKRFIAMVSSVGTSAVVFSLLALAIEGKGRTGAMLAAQQVLGDEGTKALSAFPSAPISLLLLSVLISALLGHYLTVRAGRLMARRLGGLNLRALNLGLLLFIVTLVIVFNGLPGLLLLSTAVLLGLAPPLLGIGRVHLTGCLLLPLILFFCGLQEPLLALLAR